MIKAEFIERIVNIMKKALACILLFCLCMSVPAFAAFPATWDDAASRQSVITSMNDLGNRIEEPFLCYGDAWSGPDVVAVDFNIRRVVDDNTVITIANNDTEDNLIAVEFFVYEETAPGVYQFCEKNPEGYWIDFFVLCPNGIDEYAPTMDFMSFGPAYRKLAGGESFSFKAGELRGKVAAKSENLLISIRRCFLDAGLNSYYNIYSYYELNNTKAAAIKAAANPFTDVAAGAYYYDPVLWAVNTGVTNGTSKTTFSPTSTCTRGQVVTFLWRAMGMPEPTTTNNPFTDVKDTDYFYKPVLWAVENGITNGMTATTFGPETTCTSAHVVTFLWRANGSPAVEGAGTGWYDAPVAWAKNKGLLDGTAVAFDPNNQSPRADIVTYLYRNAY